MYKTYIRTLYVYIYIFFSAVPGSKRTPSISSSEPLIRGKYLQGTKKITFYLQGKKNFL